MTSAPRTMIKFVCDLPGCRIINEQPYSMYQGNKLHYCSLAHYYRSKQKFLKVPGYEHLTAAERAKELGVSKSAFVSRVARWEQGKITLEKVNEPSQEARKYVKPKKIKFLFDKYMPKPSYKFDRMYKEWMA